MAVHRYKANESDDSESAAKAKTSTVKKTAKVPAKKIVKAKTATVSEPATGKRRRGPLVAMRDYFVGSWHELRQVRWPNRKQTWALTLAVLLFSLFLGVLIFLLDAGFTMLFKKVIF